MNEVDGQPNTSANGRNSSQAEAAQLLSQLQGSQQWHDALDEYDISADSPPDQMTATAAAIDSVFSGDDEINGDPISAARQQGRLDAERESERVESRETAAAEYFSVIPGTSLRCHRLPRCFRPFISCVKSWPRTSALVFGVICPLFLLIGVAVFFGYFLAQLEGQGVLELFCV